MKVRFHNLLPILCVMLSLGSLLFFQSSDAQTKKANTAATACRQPNKQLPPATKKAQKDLRGTINGARNPAAIPETVAYEMLLRTLAERPSRGLLEKAGFNFNQTEALLREADQFYNSLAQLDKQARELKAQRRTGPPRWETVAELQRLQTRKEENVRQWKTRQETAPDEYHDFGRLQTLMRQEIVAKAKAIPAATLRAEGQRGAPARSHAGRKNKAKGHALQNSGNVYFSGTAWIEDDQVAGSGVIAENYASDATYIITTTITAPGGRSGTSQAGYEYATLTNIGQLPIIPDDGLYTIESVFEAQEDLGGYYDEWGNWVSYGYNYYYVGSVSATQDVAPIVTLEPIVVTPGTISPSASGTPNKARVSITLSTTRSVPQNTTALIDLYEVVNLNDIDFNTTPAGTATQVRHGLPSEQNVTLGGRGLITTTSYEITSASTTQVPPTGRVDFRLHFVSVTPPSASPSPAPTRAPPTREFSITFATPTPTASPAPTPCGCPCCPTPSPSPSPAAQIPTGSNVATNTACGCPTPTPTPTPRPAGASCPPYAGSSCWAMPSASACYLTGTAGGFNNVVYDLATGCCCRYSPVLIDVEGNGYDMTDAANGAAFDTTGDGDRYLVGWPAFGSDDAWLALDRNGNGVIDSNRELFGNFTEQPPTPEPNGFVALKVFDHNNDLKIDAQDAVYSQLRLWQDRNHNGVSESYELLTLEQLGVGGLELVFSRSRRVDEHGNQYRYRGRVLPLYDSSPVGRWAWDIFPVVGNRL